jgi:hypothetical protein
MIENKRATGIRFTVPFLNSFYIGRDKLLSSRTIHYYAAVSCGLLDRRTLCITLQKVCY